MFDSNDQLRLKEKIDYENWLFEYFSKWGDLIPNTSDISTIQFSNKSSLLLLTTQCNSHVGSLYLSDFINNSLPLFFTSSYKVLDMVFEWILDVNKDAGLIAKVPWPFSKKIELIKKEKANLVWPDQFSRHPFIKDYLFALYENLVLFRGEIAHNHHFKVTSDELEIHRGGVVLKTNRNEIAIFIRILRFISQSLAVNHQFSANDVDLLKFHFDKILTYHGLSSFNQKQVHCFKVEYLIHDFSESFSIDLDKIRSELRQGLSPKASFDMALLTKIFCTTSESYTCFFPAQDLREKQMLLIDTEVIRVSRTE